MKFCNKCFSDIEIKSVISNVGTPEDRCDICKSKRIISYDTEINHELTDYFDGLISIYTPSNQLPPNFPKGELKMLKDELNDRWRIFNPKLSSGIIYDIVTNICAERYLTSPTLFDTPVGIAEQIDSNYLKGHYLLRNYTWDIFVNSLISHNRFHSRQINLELLEKFCSFIRKGYKSGDKFYRARISPEEGYSQEEMWSPPSSLAKAGRVNSKGICCFYLTNNVETAIREVRAGAFDYITIATFELKDNIVVIDLKAIDQISPFVEDFDYLEHAINKEILQRINIEMGKTLRRSDSDLDYVPTQYISDFIKSISYDGINSEYAGIEYNSTMNPSGVNLAIFEPFPHFECTNVDVYKVSELKYLVEKI